MQDGIEATYETTERRRLFTVGQITTATALGAPIAGCFLIARNYRELGAVNDGRKAPVLGSCFNGAHFIDLGGAAPKFSQLSTFRRVLFRDVPTRAASARDVNLETLSRGRSKGLLGHDDRSGGRFFGSNCHSHFGFVIVLDPA